MSNWNAVAKCLYDFEKAHAQEIESLEYDGFNAWQILKVPFFFSTINMGNTSGQKPAGAGMARRALKKITGLLILFVHLGRLFIRLSFRKGKPVLFYAFAGDKIARDADGCYFNFLTDGFILNGITPNYVYAEISNGQPGKPSKVKVDFIMDELFHLFSFFKSPAKRKLVSAEKTIDILYHKLKAFAERDNSLVVRKDIVDNIFLTFESERRMFSFFLGVCKPVFIITSEKPGTPFMAAAKKRNIPVLDLQHGLIDRRHPQYIYDGKLTAIKQNMILPQWLGLFGNFHKEELLKSGFWKESELIVLGSARMELNREKYLNKQGSRCSIVVPTQWTYFPQTHHFLETVLPTLPQGCKIILKLHPLEKEEHVTGYYSSAEKYSDRLQIAAQDEDIYPLISSSRLVIGFDSAVLLEAINLGVPCITLCTNESPKGIHSLFHNNKLESSIRPVHYSATNEVLGLLKMGLSNEQFYAEWKADVQKASENLFATSYTANCEQFIRDHLKRA